MGNQQADSMWWFGSMWLAAPWWPGVVKAPAGFDHRRSGFLSQLFSKKKKQQQTKMSTNLCSTVWSKPHKQTWKWCCLNFMTTSTNQRTLPRPFRPSFLPPAEPFKESFGDSKSTVQCWSHQFNFFSICWIYCKWMHKFVTPPNLAGAYNSTINELFLGSKVTTKGMKNPRPLLIIWARDSVITCNSPTSNFVGGATGAWIPKVKTSPRCSKSAFRSFLFDRSIAVPSAVGSVVLSWQDPKDPTGQKIEYAYQNSWGLTQRTIGVMAWALGFLFPFIYGKNI